MPYLLYALRNFFQKNEYSVFSCRGQFENFIKSLNLFFQCSGPLNFPPFTPNVLNGEEGLYIKTICMENEQKWGKHYDVHSLYGHSMAQVTDNVLKQMFPGKVKNEKL